MTFQQMQQAIYQIPKWCPTTAMSWIIVLSLQSNSMRVLLSSRNYSKSLQAPQINTGGSWVSTILVCNKTPCITKIKIHVLSHWGTKKL